jgi:hypothetical protein
MYSNRKFSIGLYYRSITNISIRKVGNSVRRLKKYENLANFISSIIISSKVLNIESIVVHHKLANFYFTIEIRDDKCHIEPSWINNAKQFRLVPINPISELPDKIRSNLKYLVYKELSDITAGGLIPSNAFDKPIPLESVDNLERLVQMFNRYRDLLNLDSITLKVIDADVPILITMNNRVLVSPYNNPFSFYIDGGYMMETNLDKCIDHCQLIRDLIRLELNIE